jgi:hypothetical protein
MRSLIFSITISAGLAFFTPIEALSQSTVLNLRGVWRAEGYECPSGSSIESEELLITQVGNNFTAVKIKGDPCVPAGYPSFFGKLTGRTSNVTFLLGHPSSPGSETGSATLIIVDKNTLTTSNGLTVRRF